MTVGEIIKDGKRRFIVLKINKKSTRVREVFITTKGKIVSMKMGDHFTMETKERK